MLTALVGLVIFLDTVGGTPIRFTLVANQIYGGWKAQKERDQYEEACREGFNPVRQKMTNERLKKVWRQVGDGPQFSIPLAYNRVELKDLEAILEGAALPLEELRFLIGEYLLTEEEVFLFDEGVKAHIAKQPHSVDFWWLKQVSKFRLENPKRADMVEELRREA